MILREKILFSKDMKMLQYWNPESFEISTYKFCLGERVNKTYTTSGTDETNLCTYTYNELGFRGDSVKKEGFKVMSLGCSNTEGVGLNYEDTWTSQFTKLIPSGVNMNFGTGGRSNDFITRCLLTFYNTIKPDLVLIMYTFPYRRELYTKGGGVEPFMPTHSWGYLNETSDGKNIQNHLSELQNDNEDFINWYKNHQLIKLFLESKNCNWLWNGIFSTSPEYEEFNRFDGTFRKYLDFAADGVHAGPMANKSYANELYSHVYTKFPNYIKREVKSLI